MQVVRLPLGAAEARGLARGSCTRGPRSRGALSELLGSHQLLVGAAAVGGGRAGKWDEEAGDGAGASSPGSAFLFGAGGHALP